MRVACRVICVLNCVVCVLCVCVLVLLSVLCNFEFVLV